jgi:hypothetical protein
MAQNDMKERSNVACKKVRGCVIFGVLGLALAACGRAEPAPAPGVSAALVLAVAAPDAGWRLSIERILESKGEVWILARLWREPGPAAQVIQPARAVVPITLPADRPRRVFVTGKTWSWENQEPYEFVPSLEPVLQRAGAGRVLYPAPAK